MGKMRSVYKVDMKERMVAKALTTDCVLVFLPYFILPSGWIEAYYSILICLLLFLAGLVIVAIFGEYAGYGGGSMTLSTFGSFKGMVCWYTADIVAVAFLCRAVGWDFALAYSAAILICYGNEVRKHMKYNRLVKEVLERGGEVVDL